MIISGYTIVDKRARSGEVKITSSRCFGLTEEEAWNRLLWVNFPNDKTLTRDVAVDKLKSMGYDVVSAEIHLDFEPLRK